MKQGSDSEPVVSSRPKRQGGGKVSGKEGSHVDCAPWKGILAEEHTWSETQKGWAKGINTLTPLLPPSLPPLLQIPTGQTQQNAEALGSLWMESTQLSWAAKEGERSRDLERQVDTCSTLIMTWIPINDLAKIYTNLQGGCVGEVEETRCKIAKPQLSPGRKSAMWTADSPQNGNIYEV